MLVMTCWKDTQPNLYKAKQITQLCYIYTLVVVILVVVILVVVVVNRMYKKRNGISLGRSPWRIDNCSIHRTEQTEESTAQITLASTLAIIINGRIVKPRMNVSH